MRNIAKQPALTKNNYIWLALFLAFKSGAAGRIRNNFNMVNNIFILPIF